MLAYIDKSPVIDLCQRRGHSPDIFFGQDFVNFQTGLINPDDFFSIKSHALGVPREEIVHIMRSMIRKGIIESLNSLQVPYLLASNINAVHYDVFANFFGAKKQTLSGTLSYQVGHLKPSLNFFHCLLDMIPSESSNIFFIDDKHENLRVSSTLGMNSIHCPSPQALPFILRKLKLIP